MLSSANDLKLVQKSLNDLEQYTRRDCLETRGIFLFQRIPRRKILKRHCASAKSEDGYSVGKEMICLFVIEFQAVGSRASVDPAIIVKFVRREIIRESLYRARKRLKSITTADFG